MWQACQPMDRTESCGVIRMAEQCSRADLSSFHTILVSFVAPYEWIGTNYGQACKGTSLGWLLSIIGATLSRFGMSSLKCFQIYLS